LFGVRQGPRHGGGTARPGRAGPTARPAVARVAGGRQTIARWSGRIGSIRRSCDSSSHTRPPFSSRRTGTHRSGPGAPPGRGALQGPAPPARSRGSTPGDEPLLEPGEDAPLMRLRPGRQDGRPAAGGRRRSPSPARSTRRAPHRRPCPRSSRQGVVHVRVFLRRAPLHRPLVRFQTCLAHSSSHNR